MTGAGGVIQSLIFGFGGWDITDDGIKKIDSVIPKEWKSLTIKGFMKEGVI
jgi:trehalose/maltose hydrolase-like predicted phosphorylase